MNKLLLLSSILIINYSVFAQSISNKETNSQFRLGLVFTPKLGFGTINETGNVQLNGFVDGGDLLISLRYTDNINLQTGLGFFEFDGNRIFNGNITSLKNNYLQIPLKFNGDAKFSENKSKNQSVHFTYGFGIYANTLLNQKTETLSASNTESNLGWNFGVLGQLGLRFNLSDKINIGIGYEVQADNSSMKKNGVERKIANLNMTYFSMEFKLK